MTTLENHRSPAREAGLRAGDRIVSVDGHRFSNWDDLPPYIQGRAGRPVEFVIQRGDKQLTLTVVPDEIVRNGERIGAVGVVRGSKLDHVDPVTGVARAGHEVARETALTVSSLGRLFGPGHLESYANQVTNQTPRHGGVKGSDSDRPVSIIGAVGITAEAADESWFYVLILLAGLNVFIGLLNMFPLPPLDGGHVAVAVYERLRSRRGRPYHADATKLVPVAVATLAVLLVLGSMLIWLDIFRPVSLQ